MFLVSWKLIVNCSFEFAGGGDFGEISSHLLRAKGLEGW